jgi:hypothetical protein
MSVVINGSAGVTTNSGAVYNGIQSATAQASTSGTAITFTNIPSWVKRITVIFSGISTNGTSLMQVQLGTSGGLATSGYTGASCYSGGGSGGTAYTTGLPLSGTGAADVRSGIVAIYNITGNTWVSSHTNGQTTNYAQFGGGNITLSGALTQLAVNMNNGTDTFDLGTVNIFYE